MANKTATLTVRIEPNLKKVLKQVADMEHRSIANMIEVLIKRHAGQQGIPVADFDREASVPLASVPLNS